MLERDSVGSDFSCHAIYKAKNGKLPDTFRPERTPEIVVYAEWFRPDDSWDASHGLWFMWHGPKDEEAIKCQRILMLCLMADMLERP